MERLERQNESLLEKKLKIEKWHIFKTICFTILIVLLLHYFLPYNIKIILLYVLSGATIAHIFAFQVFGNEYKEVLKLCKQMEKNDKKILDIKF